MKISLRTMLLLVGVTLIVSNPCALAHTDVTAQQARGLVESTNDLTVVDVRERYEYCDTGGHIPGALNYPWSSGVLEARYEELPIDGPVLVVCRSGGRSNAAASFLDSKGFSTVYDMMGGMSAWQWETAPCKYTGGSGTADDPYQIATADDLIALGETPEDYDKHFILTANIDLDPNLPGRKVFDRAVIAPNEWTLPNTPFTGVFDGNGQFISNLHIQGSAYLGLFGQLQSGASISNLGLEAVDINGTGYYVGGLVGDNGGSITTSYSTGSVSGDEDVGGLVGLSYGNITLSYCTGTVSGTGYYVGGLVGHNGGSITMSYSTVSVSGDQDVGGLVGLSSYGSITTSYSTGTVSGTGRDVGGLVGYNYEGSIITCYSTSIVSGNTDVGGLVGYNRGRIATSYSTGTVSGTGRDVGGLVGDQRSYFNDSIQGTTTTSFWDMETSGQLSSAGGLALTTAEIMDPYMLGLNGFASDPNWILDAGQDYPRLAWEGTAGQIILEPDIDWTQGHGTAENPYRLDIADELILVGRSSILWDKHFILGADINLDPNLPNVDVFRNAVIPNFMGVFDGNNHTILHLTITGENDLGLFGELTSGAEVKNLGIVDVRVTGSSNTGALVGYNREGNITNCRSTGTVTGDEDIGGLVGHNNYDGSIATSYSTVAVTGDGEVGGLVGSNTGSIATSYSSGTVTGNEHVGGLVGVNFQELPHHSVQGNITASYSTSTVTGNEHVGGLVGTGGWEHVIQCFWDTQTSGLSVSSGGISKATAEMQTATTFLEAGWDFVDETANGTEDIWWILEGQDYPRLWWEAAGR